MQKELLEGTPRPSLKQRIGVAVGGVVCAAAAISSLYFLHQAESQPPTPVVEAPVEHSNPAWPAVGGLALGGAIAWAIGRDKPQLPEA